MLGRASHGVKRVCTSAGRRLIAITAVPVNHGVAAIDFEGERDHVASALAGLLGGRAPRVLGRARRPFSLAELLE